MTVTLTLGPLREGAKKRKKMKSKGMEIPLLLVISVR